MFQVVRARQSILYSLLSCHLLLVTAITLGGSMRTCSAQSSEHRGPEGKRFAQTIAEHRKEQDLVSLAAMVMVDGKVVASAADGERKIGSGVSVGLDDRWHVGSITKSITATMIARLIESGKMSWSLTVGECFPDEDVHRDWKTVTLHQLLTHTGGAPPNFSRSVSAQRPDLGKPSAKARRKAILGVVSKSPVYAPGKKHLYSNVGYSIAAAMAEKVTGKPWTSLIQLGVYKPLDLKSGGFGPPNSRGGSLLQPQGHSAQGGQKTAVGESKLADNSFIMGPAGIVHMTLEDLCKYANEHLRGEQGKDGLLQSATFKKLHQPVLDNYGCGWGVLEIPNEPKMFWHNGSNTMWYALVVFVPDRNMVVAVASNDGDMSKAESAAFRIARSEAARDAGSTLADVAEVDPQRLEGRYQLNPTFVFDVKYENERMMVGITNQPTQEVFADSPTKWSYRSVEATLEFHLRRRGQAYALTLHQNGIKQRAKRIR